MTNKEKSVSFTAPVDESLDDQDIIELSNADLEDLLISDPDTGDIKDRNLEGVAISSDDPLRISILGDGPIAQATFGSFDSNFNQLIDVDISDNVDIITSFKPEATFVCTTVPLKEDGTLDDTELLSNIQKLEKLTQGGIILRTSVNLDTMKKILRMMSPDALNFRFTYFPVIQDTEDPLAIMSSKTHLIASKEGSLNNFFSMHRRWSVLDFSESIVCDNFYDVVTIKNMFSAYSAVRQTFFNQFFDYAYESGVTSKNNLIRMWKKLEPLCDDNHCVPSYIKARTDSKTSIKKAKSYGGEYRNKDIKLLVEETDKLTLLEECYNIRNIKD